MQNCHKKVEGCFLCSSQPCCPEHCCNWDTCTCADCQMCQKIKHVEQQAIIPDQQCLIIDETGSYMPEHEFQSALDPPIAQNQSNVSPKMKRILHSGIMKQKKQVQNQQFEEQEKINRGTQLQFAKNLNTSQPQLQANQSRSFALEASKKLQKKNPRIFKQKQQGRGIVNKSIKQQYLSSKYEEIKLNSSMSQINQKETKTENSIVLGVRGLRNLKNTKLLDDSDSVIAPKKYHPQPPPFPYQQSNRSSLINSNKFNPIINQDGSKVFQRKIIIKKSTLKK